MPGSPSITQLTEIRENVSLFSSFKKKTHLHHLHFRVRKITHVQYTGIFKKKKGFYMNNGTETLIYLGISNKWDKYQSVQLWLKLWSESGNSVEALQQRRPVPPCLNGANRSHFFTTSAYWWCVASLPTGVRFRAPRSYTWTEDWDPLLTI